jgi:hypothetical protein
MNHLKTYKLFEWNRLTSEEEDDVDYVKIMLADVGDDDVEVMVQSGRRNSLDWNYIQIRLHPNHPERDWAKGHFLRWSNLDYKVNQILDVFEGKYLLEDIILYPRFDTMENGTVKYRSHRPIKFKTLQEIESDNYLYEKTDLIEVNITISLSKISIWQ